MKKLGIKNIFLSIIVLSFGCEELLEQPNANFSIQDVNGLEVSTVVMGDTVRFVPDDLTAEYYSVWPGDSLHIYQNPEPVIDPRDTTEFIFDFGFEFSPNENELFIEHVYDTAGEYTVVMIATNAFQGELERSVAERVLEVTAE